MRKIWLVTLSLLLAISFSGCSLLGLFSAPETDRNIDATLRQLAAAGAAKNLEAIEKHLVQEIIAQIEGEELNTYQSANRDAVLNSIDSLWAGKTIHNFIINPERIDVEGSQATVEGTFYIRYTDEAGRLTVGSGRAEAALRSQNGNWQLTQVTVTEYNFDNSLATSPDGEWPDEAMAADSAGAAEATAAADLAAGAALLAAGSGPQYQFAQCDYLTKGEREEQVKALQTALNFLGYKAGLVDGYFGPITEKAVKAFQKDAGVPVDGEFGPKTITALHAALQAKGGSFACATATDKKGKEVKLNLTPNLPPVDGPIYNFPACRIFGLGQTDAQIKALQDSLNYLGYKAGAKDGYFGPITEKAVKQFQKDMGLTADGRFNPETIAALDQALQTKGGAFNCAVVDTTPRLTRTVRTLGAGTTYATDLYIIDSGVPGPDFVIAAGIHLPIEVSGTRAFEPGAALDVNRLSVDRGRLFVVPRFNNKEISRSKADMNRFWGGSGKYTTGDNAFAREWFNLIKGLVEAGTYGFGLDIHDGFANSLGNTFIGGSTIAKKTVDYLNTLPETRKSKAHQKSSNFTRIFDGAFKYLSNPVSGSWTRAVIELLDAPASEMELTGQVRSSAPQRDPLSLRIFFIEQAVKYIGKQLGMTITVE
ncbi:MAG TPA: hypothetical protein GXX29_04470 [Firmicutes bacterium]|nr:hypothetical protein [Bacillota bacterium]